MCGRYLEKKVAVVGLEVKRAAVNERGPGERRGDEVDSTAARQQEDQDGRM